MELTLLDFIVFFVFVGGVALFGCSFFKRSSKSAAAFTKAEGSIPAWVVGMSIFATFVSSISFLGLPGGAYSGNWNQLIFSFTIPVATWLAAKVFIPLYRGVGVIAWMSLPVFHSPVHTYLTIVFGIATIFLTGLLLAQRHRSS